MITRTCGYRQRLDAVEERVARKHGLVGTAVLLCNVDGDGIMMCLDYLASDAKCDTASRLAPTTKDLCLALHTTTAT